MENDSEIKRHMQILAEESNESSENDYLKDIDKMPSSLMDRFAKDFVDSCIRMSEMNGQPVYINK